MQLAVATLTSGKPSAAVHVVCDGSACGMQVSRSCAAVLTTHRSQVVEQPLSETVRGTYRLSPPAENPFLSDAAKRALDDTGLIRTQTMLEPGSVLASILYVHSGNDPSIGKAPPGMVRVEDDSLVCDPNWVGMLVCSVEILPPEKRGLRTYTSLRMTLECLHELEVGDVLLLGNVAAPVAQIVDSPESEIRLDLTLGRALGLDAGQARSFEVFVADCTARSALAARSTGPYSLITQTPLGGRLRTRGQVVSPPHIQTLRCHGLRHTLLELLTYKSTDAGNRAAMRRALAGEGPFPPPGAPFGLHVLQAELRVLGFRPELLATGDHLSLALTPMTDAERLASSSGEVIKPETLNYRTYKPERGGLFCESIFGQEENPERALNFGHVNLAQAIVPFHWRERRANNAPSFLAEYLRINDEQLDKIMSYEEGVTITEDQELFETMPQQGGAATNAVTGAEAVALLVAQARKRNPNLPDISALLFHRVLFVLPPDLRPLVLLSSGNFATSDLNDHYRRVINRNNRLRKLIELQAPELIIRNEKRMLQQTVDGLFDNVALKRPVLGSANRPLMSIWAMVLSRLQSDAAMRCDFSASAHAVPNPMQDPMTAGVPASILSTLGVASGDPILLTRPAPAESSAPLVILRAIPREHQTVTLPPAIYAGLFAPHAELPLCVIHRPLTPEARMEAVAHLGTLMTGWPPEEVAWCSPGEVKFNLLMAALESTPLPFSSPQLLAVAGPGINTLTPLPKRDAQACRWQDIPAPLA